MATVNSSHSGSSSVCSASTPPQTHRVMKRPNRALFDETDVPMKANRVTFAAPEQELPNRRTREATMGQKSEEVEDYFGFNCGARFNEIACGGNSALPRSKKREKEDSFGVVGRVRTMIKEKFSSRIDFSPSESRPNVTFVEHRV